MLKKFIYNILYLKKKKLEDIKRIDRFKEPPRHGIFCDMLWADPVDNDDGVCENIFR